MGEPTGYPSIFSGSRSGDPQPAASEATATKAQTDRERCIR
jgi:hypothetical protein